MENSKNHNISNEESFDIEKMAFNIDGVQQEPTREEFYTNYPFYKYWNSKDNDKLLNPEGINIYIHIPFCIQICDYCFFMKELIKSKEQVNEYVDALCEEIKLVSEKFGLGNRKVNSIYMGGGTPSVLTEVQFKKLMETLHKYHNTSGAEFAFEVEPGTFSTQKLQWYKESGVNRISMGIQSFDDKIIELSSRKHTSKQAINSIKMVKEVGDFSLNIDLLSGLAGEEMSTWEQSVETALSQNIDLLTIYKMKTYANTAFFKKGVHGKEINLPSAEEEIEYMRRAIEMILGVGYKMWTNFAFSKDGESRSKYVEHVWRGEDLIAYGSSSYGKIGNVNYQNINNIPLYVKNIKKNEMPIYRTYSLSVKDTIVRELLLCSARLSSYSKAEFEKKFGFDYFELIPETIDQLVYKGYITNNKEDLELTKQGILFGDFISKTIASSVKKKFSMDEIKFAY